MCEFCPHTGRCIVCDHISHPINTKPTRVADVPHCEGGYVVLLGGVRVRYNNRPDVLVVLREFPSARVV